MTTAGVVRMLVRRWYLTLSGAVASLVVLWVAVHQPPVYFAQVDVLLLPPADTTQVNTLREGPYLLAPLAGLVAKDVNRGLQPSVTASPTTTLYGEGVREGERVRLRNQGSQWRPVFESGVIDVQVVGPEPDAVRDRIGSLVGDLDRALAERQEAARVAPPQRATLQGSPADPVVQQVGTSRMRAAGSVAVLGATLTFLAVAFVDRLLLRRRTRRDRAVALPGPAATAARVPEVVSS